MRFDDIHSTSTFPISTRNLSSHRLDVATNISKVHNSTLISLEQSHITTMSKITPKNLSYDTTLPPFLARLQSQNTNTDGRQDYHAARPKKARDLDAEAEDEPVFFDEKTGDTLTKKEWEEREKFGDGSGEVLVQGDDAAGDEKEAKPSGDEDEGKKKEKVATIGGSKKRKAGKIIGGGEEEEEGSATALKAAVRQATSALGKTNDSMVDVKAAAKASEDKPVKKSGGAKKGKKIKLSFGDDE